MKKIRKAFTLIEMVIVLFIISLLLLIMIPNLAMQKNKADDRSKEAFKTTIVTQAELYADNENLKENKVSLNDLLGKGYITKSQVDKADRIGVNADTNLLDIHKSSNA